MLMTDCVNGDESFDALSETDSNEEMQIMKVEHFAKCFIGNCQESFCLLDKLYDHVARLHYTIRFSCMECFLCTDKYAIIMRHRIIHHIGVNKNNLYECFYCKRYNSIIAADLVNHLMSCIIVNNDRDGHKLAKFMKDLKDAREASVNNNNNNLEESVSQLRVDIKTGKVFYKGAHVSNYPDQHTQISSNRKLLQTSLSTRRADKHEIYDMIHYNFSKTLLEPTGNIHAFLHKINRFSHLAVKKSKR